MKCLPASTDAFERADSLVSVAASVPPRHGWRAAMEEGQNAIGRYGSPKEDVEIGH